MVNTIVNIKHRVEKNAIYVATYHMTWSETYDASWSSTFDVTKNAT